MPIPDFETIMRPLLAHLSDAREHGTQDTLDALASDFGLTESELRRALPSGKQGLFRNRVAWAKFYLKKAGLVANPRRGVYHITDLGLEWVQSQQKLIKVATLQEIPAFRNFLLGTSTGNGPATQENSIQPAPPPPRVEAFEAESQLTPEELLETGYGQLVGQLAADLLDRAKQASPDFFEHLVVDLLLALGYGGSRRDAGRTIGRSGDGGIDGIINEDRLGLDTIYIQAKRWEGVVGRPEVQKFAGALQGQRARKGIFITSSSFTKDAMEYVRHLDSKIILIDGDQLTRLMIEHNVGVTPVAAYEVKRVDSDYFTEE